MIFYYGADRKVEKPIYNYSESNPSNDYGIGFYLTKEKDKAELWASQFDEGYCIKYEFDMKDLKVLYLNSNTKEEIMLWISILVNNRFSKEEIENNKETIEWLNSHYHVNLDEYDVIVGYRADDSYFLYSRDFVSNDLSIDALSKAMKLGKLGLQYCLKSEKVFKKIKTLEYKKIEKNNDYAVYREKIRQEYIQTKENDDIHNDRLLDIMRKAKWVIV